MYVFLFFDTFMVIIQIVLNFNQKYICIVVYYKGNSFDTQLRRI